MLDKIWTPGVPLHQLPHYQPVKSFTYWSVLSYFNNWNIVQFSHQATTIDDVENINQVAFDGISDNMASLVRTGQYGTINTIDYTTIGYYVIVFFL